MLAFAKPFSSFVLLVSQGNANVLKLDAVTTVFVVPNVRLEEFLELICVVGAVCKMCIRPYKHSMPGIFLRGKHEVVLLVCAGSCRFETLEELRDCSIDSHPVILWNRNKYEYVLALRSEIVASFSVCGCNKDSVGNGYSCRRPLRLPCTFLL